MLPKTFLPIFSIKLFIFKLGRKIKEGNTRPKIDLVLSPSFPTNTTLLFMMVEFGNNSVLCYYGTWSRWVMKETFLSLIFLNVIAVLYSLTFKYPNSLNIVWKLNYRMLCKFFNIETKMETGCHIRKKKLLIDGGKRL